MPRSLFIRPRIAIAALAGLAIALPAWAQPGDARDGTPPGEERQGPQAAPPEDLDVYEGRLIGRIDLRRPVRGEEGEVTFEALEPDVDQFARNQLRSRPGGAYQSRIIQEDITRLNRIGRFSNVESRVQLLEDGSVAIIYTLAEQPIVRDVQSVGNRQISDQDIAEAVDILIDTPVDRYQLDRASRSIEDLYRRRGYYLAQVKVDEDELRDSGIVLFRIREGERVRVTSIRYEGNFSFEPSELGTVIKTKRAFPILEKGPLDDDVLADDVAALVKFYQDRGYLDVRVDRAVQPSPNGREAIVSFIIDEGRLYTLRSVEIFYPDAARGYPTMEQARAEAKPGERVLQVGVNDVAVYPYGVYSPEQVIGLMEIKPGDVYSVDKLDNSIKGLEDAYGKLGYADARVDKRELRDPVRPEVDLLIIVREGLRYRTGEVIVQGNELTQQKVIRRQIQVKPERPLDTTAVRDTELRLRRLNLFDRTPPNSGARVTAQEPDPLEQEYRDVLVQVEETNTGSLTFGAAVSSDAGLVGRIAFNQRNFDLADTPDTAGEFFSGRSFRGGGQTFQIEALPGEDVQTYSISLTEPYLLESDYSTTVAGFYRTRDYSEYDEERFGGRVAFGRRFGSRWNASFPLRIESVNLSDIEPDMPVDVFAVEDQNWITGAGITLSRSSLDDSFRPGKGSKIELGVEQVGALGGDFTFTAFRAEHQIFFTVNEDFGGRKTVLSFNTRAGYIPQGQDDTPVYERFYMGGQSFRGFRFRNIAPKGIRNDNKQVGDDPVGGTWMFFFGPEIKQPLFGTAIGDSAQELELAVAGFIDTGTVLEEIGFDEYRVTAGVGLRLYIPQLSPAPLAFDFGFPLVSEESDRERVFSFSVDLPFQ